ncbi:unnamed protein product [Leptosia nina]|uniref:Carboxylic ester hydrolase n=1 Tax=Leptosia nina TaxID=320188 RepID=A0AAV1J169_9NEOP
MHFSIIDVGHGARDGVVLVRKVGINCVKCQTPSTAAPEGTSKFRRLLQRNNSRAEAVLTKNGWVRGVKSRDGDYDMFLGIPYGRVKQDNPFGDAEPFGKYDGVFEAIDNSKICPQLDELSKTFGGTIDCLNINVYVPRSRTGKLAVMVYIFGGQFRFGFAGNFKGYSMYGPRHLLRYNIIYIIFNNRLGPYGYMCLGTRKVPGNAGLKDQSLALKWVKDNIEAFGGDSNKITLFGHSSGAVSVDLHIHYQPSDLFQQAILQSGSITFRGSVGNINTSVPLILADKLGLSTNDVDAALLFLTKKDPIDVVKVSVNTIKEYNPCVEQKIQGVRHMITHDPKRLVPKVEKRKIMIGHTREESNMLYAKIPKEYFDNNDVFKYVIPLTFDLNQTQLNLALSEVKHFYIGDNLVYYYVFTYCGGRNLHKVVNNITADGAMHADEVGYIYQPTFFEDTTQNDQLIVDKMTKMWTNFAKYGNPTPTPTKLLPETWIPITEESKPYLRIDLETHMDIEILPRIAFWDQLFKKYSKYIRN